METSFGALSDEVGTVLTGPRAAPAAGPLTPSVTWQEMLAAGRQEAGRYAGKDRLPAHCPGPLGIAAAVPAHLFTGGAGTTQSQPCPADPSGGTFFPRAEFPLDALAGRSGAVS